MDGLRIEKEYRSDGLISRFLPSDTDSDVAAGGFVGQLSNGSALRVSSGEPQASL